MNDNLQQPSAAHAFAVDASRQAICAEVLRQRAVAVVRLRDSTHALSVVDALAAGGMSIVEITLTTPNAVDIIREIAARSAETGILVGAGSVLDGASAGRCIEAGAKFLVSPIVQKEMIELAHAAGIPAMMGAFSPTEIAAAHDAGADITKVFPADALSPAYFKAVLAPMPYLRLMPTGGVTLTNAGQWLAAGACAVGVGGALIDAAAIAEQRFDVLTEHARTVCRAVAPFC
jgi:2-dehydro-3-deoxyphosphogluconate aldolase/(4S)-4-hydroxy-2-oxoglutarate aldolase